MDDEPKNTTAPALLGLALALPLIGGIAEFASKAARRTAIQETSIAARMVLESEQHRLPVGKLAEAELERRNQRNLSHDKAANRNQAH